MTKCLIIEDEELAERRLIRLLKKVGPEFEVAQKCQSVARAVEILKQSKFDLIFLDIHLADGLSFEIFRSLEIDTPIIFTTAYDQYALRAFKQNSIDYLLKPVQEEELAGSLEKFEKSNKSLSRGGHDFDKIMEVLNRQGSQYKERFMVQVADKIRSIDEKDIHYFFAEGKTVYMITSVGKRYYVNYTLSELQDALDPQKYFRCNRKIILRIDSLIEVHTYSKSKLKVIMKNKPSFDVFVPSERITSFKKWLN